MGHTLLRTRKKEIPGTGESWRLLFITLQRSGVVSQPGGPVSGCQDEKKDLRSDLPTTAWPSRSGRNIFWPKQACAAAGVAPKFLRSPPHSYLRSSLSHPQNVFFEEHKKERSHGPKAIIYNEKYCQDTSINTVAEQGRRLPCFPLGVTRYRYNLRLDRGKIFVFFTGIFGECFKTLAFMRSGSSYLKEAAQSVWNVFCVKMLPS